MDDDDDKQLSPDDALEPKDDIYDPESNQTHLARDYDSPASPADDTGKQTLPADHPLGDDDVDDQELYDEGFDSATGSDAQEEEPDNSPKPFEFK